jgi:hypothetical protein
MSAARERLMTQLRLMEPTPVEEALKKSYGARKNGATYAFLQMRIEDIFGEEAPAAHTVDTALSPSRFPNIRAELLYMICVAAQTSPWTVLPPPGPEATRYQDALAALDHRHATDVEVYEEFLEVVISFAEILRRHRRPEAAAAYVHRVGNAIRALASEESE